HAVRLRRPTDGHGERRHVARHRGVVGNEGMRADHAELVHAGEAAHVHPVAHFDVPAERCVVREHAMRADHAVVPDMRAGHEQIVVGDARDQLVLGRAAVDRAVFAERVAVADLQARRLASILQVLRRRADRGELEDAVLATDRGRSFDNGVRADPGAGADGHAGADHCVRTDLDVRRELRVRRDERGGMNAAHCPGATIISALVASWPSTSATVENFQMPRSERSSVAFRISWSPGSTGRRKRALSMPTKYSSRFSSGYTPAVTKARMPAVCARASRIRTPGNTGRAGKCPGKNGSLIVTFLIARIDCPEMHSSTRSTSRKG